MRHLSLFSGIGGFDLAAQWMGWANVAHCEIDPFCRQILKYYWPDAITYSDIRKTDFSVHHGTVDIISGGFPCQPYSVAGLRKGKEDDRHLWPEMLRAIREVSPRWVVGENVRGLINWNGGMVFDEVQADLEAEGYEVLPFLLPACAVNAPHRRDRVWFIAHSNSFQRPEGGVYSPRREASERHISTFNTRNDWRAWENFPTQPPVCGGNDGLPTQLDGIAFSKWRNGSLKAYGNAVVPQVVFQIFKAIQKYETTLST